MEDYEKVVDVTFRLALLKSAQDEIAKLQTWKEGFEAAGKQAPTFYQITALLNYIHSNCKEVKKK